MALSLKQLTLDVWLLETLRRAPGKGYTLEHLQQAWTSKPSHEGVLGRTTMARHRKMIEDFFGVIIDSPDKKHYRIANPEQLTLNTLANELLASLQEYIFLDEYRELGDKIQPAQIWEGIHLLQPIGEALRHNKKIAVRYQKFTDTEPYDAILHPYCLKADKGRWYLLAHKEKTLHEGVNVQVFALDRIQQLQQLETTFRPDESIDLSTFFRDCFGIWRDYDHYPVRDITIAVKPHVAHYLRTLPLHHSQKELSQSDTEWRCFTYHISPTPDFFGELAKWGDALKIVE